jgi:hypothetical protein
MKMIVEKQMECRLAGETEVLGGNRSSRRKPAPAPLLSITKSHMIRPGFEPGPPRWEAGDYGWNVETPKEFHVDWCATGCMSGVWYVVPVYEVTQFTPYSSSLRLVLILWRVRVAPLIIVDYGSLESVYWILNTQPIITLFKYSKEFQRYWTALSEVSLLTAELRLHYSLFNSGHWTPRLNWNLLNVFFLF